MAALSDGGTPAPAAAGASDAGLAADAVAASLQDLLCRVEAAAKADAPCSPAASGPSCGTTPPPAACVTTGAAPAAAAATAGGAQAAPSRHPGPQLLAASCMQAPSQQAASPPALARTHQLAQQALVAAPLAAVGRGEPLVVLAAPGPTPGSFTCTFAPMAAAPAMRAPTATHPTAAAPASPSAVPQPALAGAGRGCWLPPAWPAAPQQLGQAWAAEANGRIWVPSSLAGEAGTEGGRQPGSSPRAASECWVGAGGRATSSWLLLGSPCSDGS